MIHHGRAEAGPYSIKINYDKKYLSNHYYIYNRRDQLMIFDF
jgi:hypothetical protein